MAFNHGVRVFNGTVTDGANNHIWSWSTVGSISYLSGLGLCLKELASGFIPTPVEVRTGVWLARLGLRSFWEGDTHNDR